jgi:hypothetical protein
MSLHALAGPSSVIAGLQKAWFGEAATSWSRDRSLIVNLQAVLHVQLPPRVSRVDERMEGGWGGTLQQQAIAAAAAPAAAASSPRGGRNDAEIAVKGGPRQGKEQPSAHGELEICAKTAEPDAVVPDSGVDEKLLECAICYAYHLPDADASAEGRC